MLFVYFILLKKSQLATWQLKMSMLEFFSSYSRYSREEMMTVIMNFLYDKFWENSTHIAAWSFKAAYKAF